MTAPPEPPSEPNDPGPPELRSLLRRLEESDNAARENAEHDPSSDPDPAPHPEPEESFETRVRMIAGLLGLAVIPALWVGPDLRPPFNAIALLSSGLLCFIVAMLERALKQFGFMWMDLVIGIVLVLYAIALLLV